MLAIGLAMVGCGSDDDPGPSGPPCATGFTRLPSGGCAPILPPPCDEASIAVPGDVACRRIGVTACAAGFSPDAKGGCEPVLPAAACAAGTMAVPGFDIDVESIAALDEKKSPQVQDGGENTCGCGTPAAGSPTAGR